MIETAVRGGAVAILGLLGLILLRDGRRAAAGFYAGLFALSIAAYVIEAAPAVLPMRAPWLVPLRMASAGASAVLYLFARACFDDEFRASWRDGAPWLALVALGFGCGLSHVALACIAFQGTQLLFVALAVRQALLGRSADLVEERRRFRLVLVIAAATYSAAVIVLQLVERGPPSAPPLSTANALGLLLFAFATAVAQLSLSRRGQLMALDPLPAGPPLSADPVPGTNAAAGDEADAALLQRLRRLMDEEKAYREEGLSIGALAAKLDLPEYRLRRLINQRLGHRNFSAFVNGYRLAEAMAALGDPGQAAVPIVTIALDAGFQSLGPFNRAFKLHTGMTPTDFRRTQLGQGVEATH